MKQYIADAFTDKVFGGNPAAVCVMDSWLSDDLMLAITSENNLSETAFAVKQSDSYALRWFTPGGEIDLCGHATLATAFIIMNYIEKGIENVTFDTLSGRLTVTEKEGLYEMDFPTYDLKPAEITNNIVSALGAKPKEAYIGRDLLCVFEDEDTVRNLSPDMEKLKDAEGLLLHATAKGRRFDCVSRSFAPKLNVPEDPVCGSGHCHIAPYWAERLGKKRIVAYQASRRGGTLYCTVQNGRVKLAGKAALYAVSDIFITDN